MATATLGIQIESGGAVKAAADLDKFAASARGAEVATAKVTSNVIPFRTAVDAVGSSSRHTAFMMRNLSFQVNDIATGLASGQSPFMILAQQGGQVYQALQMGPGGVGGSLQAIKATLLGLITPARLAAAGLAAIGIAGVVAYQSWKSATLGVDDAARAAGIAQQEFSKLQAAASFKGIGASDFQEGMKTFAKNLDDARFKTGDLFKLFDANKVTITDNATAFAQLANLIKGAATDTQALYYIQQAGLPPTMEWLRLLQGGADAIEKAKQQAAAFAANEEMIRKAREFDEAWNQAWTNFKANSLTAIQSALAGLSSLSDAATGLLAKIPGLGGAAGIGENLLKAGRGTPLSQDVSSMYGGLLSPQGPLKITVDPRSIKEAKTEVDHLAEAMRRLNEQRTTALEKAQRETTELLSFTGASRSAALAQSELAKYRERNISVTPQLETEIRAWASQVAAVQDLNKAIKTVKDAAVDFTQSLVSGLMQGQGLMQSLSGAAKSLSTSLVSGGIQNLAQGNLITGALQVGGGLLANLLGGNNQQKQQQQQQAQQQALQAQQAQQQKTIQAEEAAMASRFQAATMGIDTSTKAGAMAMLESNIARERAEAAKLGGNAVVAYEELAQAKRLQLEKEWAEKAENIRRDYLDREFAALNDNSTIAGKLAEYERKAAREREDAVKNGGLALVELDRAQAAERGKILKDALKEQTDYYDGLRNTISDFTRGLQFGNLSTLSPAEQFLAARNDFQNQLALAQGGDRNAQGGITNVAQTLIEQARNYLGPSVEFGNIVSRITDQLNALPGIGMENDPQVQELQRLGGDYFGPMNDYLSQIAVSTANLPMDIAEPIAAAVNNSGGAAVVAELQLLRGDVVDLLAATRTENKVQRTIIAQLIAEGNASQERVGQGVNRLRTDIRTSNSSSALRAAG